MFVRSPQPVMAMNVGELVGYDGAEAKFALLSGFRPKGAKAYQYASKIVPGSSGFANVATSSNRPCAWATPVLSDPMKKPLACTVRSGQIVTGAPLVASSPSI